MNLTNTSHNVLFSCILPQLPDIETARLAFTCRVLKQRVYRYFQEKHRSLVVDHSIYINATELAKWPPLPYLEKLDIALLHQTRRATLPLLAAEDITLEIRHASWVCSLAVRVTDVQSLKGQISLPLNNAFGDRTVAIHILNQDGARAWRHTLPSGGLWEKAKHEMPQVHAPIRIMEFSSSDDDDPPEPRDPPEEPDDSELASMAEHDANDDELVWWEDLPSCKWQRLE
jgi:hypothetical protein